MGQLGWVIFLLALCVSIMVHETGHFVAAKKFGMKATRYFLGFGPTLWSTWRGETEYGVKAFPLGGFVKIVGMHSLDDLDDPYDEPRSFRRHPAWQRLIVMYAGVLMNFALAFVLVVVMFLAIGMPVASNASQLGQVSPCVAATTADLNQGICGSSTEVSPAKAAGLQAGDTITSFNDKPVRTWNQLTSAIKDVKPGTTVNLTVLRDGRTLAKTITVGKVPGRPGGYLGIDGVTLYQVLSPLGAVQQAGSFFSVVVTGTVSAFGHLPSAASKMFSSQRSAASGGQLCSVICAGDQTSQAVGADTGWRAKAETVIVITAELNLLLGLGNMLPLMPLDGGLGIVVLWESLRSRFARLRGRPDPGLVDIRKVLPVMFSVFAVFVLFVVVVMFADVFNPLQLGQ